MEGVFPFSDEETDSNGLSCILKVLWLVSGPSGIGTRGTNSRPKSCCFLGLPWPQVLLFLRQVPQEEEVLNPQLVTGTQELSS